MAELKTKPTEVSVAAFLASIPDARRRAEGETLLAVLGRASGEPARMWGPSIVGFGSYHYRYESGHEGDACLTGFSPRQAALSIYVLPGFARYQELLQRLGKHKAGKACLYVKRLTDIDLAVLEELVRASVEQLRLRYPPR